MKKNGFTLVEVIGVIIILTMLFIIIMPSVINSLKKSQDELSEATLAVIYAAADLYAEKKGLARVTDNVYCVSLNDIVHEGLLTSPIIDASTGDPIDLSSKVEITYTNNFFEFDMPTTCTPVIN